MQGRVYCKRIIILLRVLQLFFSIWTTATSCSHDSKKYNNSPPSKFLFYYCNPFEENSVLKQTYHCNSSELRHFHSYFEYLFCIIRDRISQSKPKRCWWSYSNFNLWYVFSNYCWTNFFLPFDTVLAYKDKSFYMQLYYYL